MTPEERLARVERQLRWFKRLGALAIAVGAAVVLAGQAEKKELQELVVRSLKVVDKEGRVRAELGPFEHHGTVLHLTDQDGKISVGLGVWGGPVFGFADGKETILALGAARSPQDGTVDLDLHAKLKMNLVGDGAAFVIKDKAGEVIWKAPGE